MIRNTFVAGVAALAIGATGLTATPAQASDDTTKIITGLAALAIIGTAISKSRKDDHHGVSRSRGYAPYYYGHRGRSHYRHKHRGHHRYKHRHHRRHGGHRHKRYH